MGVVREEAYKGTLIVSGCNSIADRFRRLHLLFLGDGAFQMTAQELSTILWRDLNPMVFLLNNDGYTIERLIYGADSSYNDINPWRYW
jgi:TPP-dependent 2-oxoacid decarboxylase